MNIKCFNLFTTIKIQIRFDKQQLHKIDINLYRQLVNILLAKPKNTINNDATNQDFINIYHLWLRKGDVNSK